jgi:MutL protein
MQIEVLTIEVGSTITKANGFSRARDGVFEHIAQGFGPTTVAAGDVGIGVEQAIDDLRSRSAIGISDAEIHVNSSAAGGLRMTVHGLTYGMTARAAREAALGAGAIVELVTAGILSDADLDEIRSIRPNLVLLAGGVDYGETEPILRNAEALASLRLQVPVLYAGNAAIRQRVRQTLEAEGVETLMTDNVFPEVDVLNVDPVRRLIHEAFNRHIVHAPGMARLQELTRERILPTPGAVLRGAELFADAVGDCAVIDVGGATTDVHSVTDGSPEWTAKMTEPEPRAKRTVEGDLGVYLNARNVAELIGEPDPEARLRELRPVPRTEPQFELTRWLCRKAVEVAIRRHAGVITDMYTASGKRQVVKGKDLTSVQWLIGTGGALTRVPGGDAILRDVSREAGKYLLPPAEVRVLIDRDYRFSALGTLAHVYPDEVRATFHHWVESAMAARS